MTGRLGDLLSGAVAPGVYRYTSCVGTGAIARQVERAGRRLFYLDGRQITRKHDFLQACAWAMALPAYAGHNWDALEESLHDLSWAPAERGYLVLYDQAGRFAVAEPDEFAVALDILRGAIERWRATATPMAVLLRGLGLATGAVPRL